MEREKQIGVEFAKVVTCYKNSKLAHAQGDSLSAFHQMVNALYHQGNVSLLENDLQPDVCVWEQVKANDYETYKLYVELISGEEELTKRIDLLLIANEFVIMRRVRSASRHIQSIMGAAGFLWTKENLLLHPELQWYQSDLNNFLDFLIDKQVIKSVLLDRSENGVPDFRYCV